jgi:hypothetical protein
MFVYASTSVAEAVLQKWGGGGLKIVIAKIIIINELASYV